jgi:hypothetical protein
MKYLLFCFLILAGSLSAFSQKKEQNVILDPSNCTFYKFSISGDLNTERAKYISNELYGVKKVLISYTDAQAAITWVLMRNEGDVREVASKVASLGYSLSGQQEIPFNDDLFLEVYCGLGNTDKSVISKQFPNYVRTANDRRDELLYKNAKNIWINKYPEQYKAMFSTEMTEEQIREKQMKDQNQK